MSLSHQELHAELEALTARLERWRRRLAEARELRRHPDLDPERRAAATAFLQELQDRCDRAENSILRLRRCWEGWQDSEQHIERSFHGLAEAWQSVQLALVPDTVRRPAAQRL